MSTSDVVSTAVSTVVIPLSASILSPVILATVLVFELSPPLIYNSASGIPESPLSVLRDLEAHCFIDPSLNFMVYLFSLTASNTSSHAFSFTCRLIVGLGFATSFPCFLETHVLTMILFSTLLLCYFDHISNENYESHEWVYDGNLQKVRSSCYCQTQLDHT